MAEHQRVIASVSPYVSGVSDPDTSLELSDWVSDICYKPDSFLTPDYRKLKAEALDKGWATVRTILIPPPEMSEIDPQLISPSCAFGHYRAMSPHISRSTTITQQIGT